jgi:hypothetical protein
MCVNVRPIDINRLLQVDCGPPPKHKVLQQCAQVLAAIDQVSIWKQEFKPTPIHVGFNQEQRAVG